MYTLYKLYLSIVNHLCKNYPEDERKRIAVAAVVGLISTPFIVLLVMLYIYWAYCISEPAKYGFVKGRVENLNDVYGNVITYEYDNFDRLVLVKQANGLITKTVYNKQYRVSMSILIAGDRVRMTQYTYDNRGNLIETTLPDGRKIKATYNNDGRKISETNQLYQTRTFEYDDNGQLIKVTLPDGATYKYAYDAQGNQTSIIDPLNRETTFTYDDNGNQLTRTLPDGSTEYFEYDFKGRLIKQTSFEGVVTTYSYDEFERLASKTFTANGITETWIYTYDQFGRVSEIDQAGRIVKTTYDAQGRTILIETPEGKISYTYDMFGRQTSVQTDDDLPVVYTYDNFGRLSSVTSDGKTTNYEYDAFGNLAKTTLPNGVITTYEYDNMNRLIKETNYVDKNNNKVMDEGEGIAQFEYTLDAQGRKLNAKEKFWLEYGKQENNIDWMYDEAGRLIYEKFDHYNDEFDQTLLWEYDLVSNRTTQKLDKGNDGTVDEVTKYTYDKNDRLLKEQHDAQNDGNFEKTTTYGYDHTQQTSKTVSVDGIKTNETTYAYDLQGRMAVVIITTFADDGTIARNERISYGYDESGIRVSALHEVDADGDGTFDTAKLTEYLNDPLNITGYSQVLKQTETDLQTNEQIVTTYVMGHQRISQTVIKDGLKQEYYFTLDGHGSTRVLTDIVGSMVELYAYDAFGNAIGFDPSIALTEFLYSGEQFDSKIGQQYLRQRYHDPATGRFNRLDPFFGNTSDPLSLHKYLYTHGDPVNGVDPTGKMSLGGAMMAGAIVGSISGLSIGSIYGMYTGYNRTGSIFTLDIIKYGLIGAVSGAAVGAFTGASIYFSPYILESLKIVMGSGWRAFVQKCANPMGHSTTENLYKMGLVVGFGLGLYDPHFITELQALGATGTTITSDIFIRGLIARRSHWATASASRAFVRVLSSYAQSATFLSSGFFVGFTIGYPLGSTIRIAGDALLHSFFNEIMSDEYIPE